MTEEVKDTVQTVDAAQTVTQETPATETPATETPVEQDLAIIRAKKEELIAAGETLFKDEIASLEEKEKTLTAQIETEAEKVGTEVVAVEKSFRDKYGNIIANGIEIVGIGAILYRLFIF